MKKIVTLIVFLSAAAVTWYLLDVQKDRSKSVNVLKSVPIYQEWEPMSGQPKIGTLEPGQKLKVLRIRYGKDYMAIKIHPEGVSEGWIIFQRDTVELNKD